MKKRTDFLDAFRKSNQDLKITPSSSAWRKLEQKLETKRRRRRVQLYSITSIAAAIALVLTMAAILPLFERGQQTSQVYTNPVPRSLEPLNAVMDGDAEALKAVEFSRQNIQTGRPIAEGSSGQKLVLAFQQKSGTQR